MELPASPPTGPPLQPPTGPMYLGPVTGEAPSVMPRPGISLPAGSMLTGRTVIAMVLLFLAGMSLVAGTASIWTRSQLLDTDTWAATTTAIATDPVVQEQVARSIAEQIVASSDVEAAIAAALPGPLGQLAGPLAGGATTLIEQAVLQVVRTDAFVTIWDTAVRAAHSEFTADLEGRGTLTSIDSNGLSLDLGAVLESVRTALDDRGITVLDSLDLSSVDVRVLLIDAPGLDNTRTAVKTLRVVSIALFGFGAVCLVVGLLVARRRAMALLSGGVGMLFGVASVTLIAYVVRGRAATELTGGVLDRSAADAIVDHVTGGLRPVMLSGAVLAVALIVISGLGIVLSERRASRTAAN